MKKNIITVILASFGVVAYAQSSVPAEKSVYSIDKDKAVIYEAPEVKIEYEAEDLQYRTSGSAYKNAPVNNNRPSPPTQTNTAINPDDEKARNQSSSKIPK